MTRMSYNSGIKSRNNCGSVCCNSFLLILAGDVRKVSMFLLLMQTYDKFKDVR